MKISGIHLVLEQNGWMDLFAGIHETQVNSTVIIIAVVRCGASRFSSSPVAALRVFYQ